LGDGWVMVVSGKIVTVNDVPMVIVVHCNCQIQIAVQSRENCA